MSKRAAGRTGKRQPTHDSGYKLLFAPAAVVRDLLRGFMPGARVCEFDLGIAAVWKSIGLSAGDP